MTLGIAAWLAPERGPRHAAVQAEEAAGAGRGELLGGRLVGDDDRHGLELRAVLVGQALDRRREGGLERVRRGLDGEGRRGVVHGTRSVPDLRARDAGVACAAVDPPGEGPVEGVAPIASIPRDGGVSEGTGSRCVRRRGFGRAGGPR